MSTRVGLAIQRRVTMELRNRGGASVWVTANVVALFAMACSSTPDSSEGTSALGGTGQNQSASGGNQVTGGKGASTASAGTLNGGQAGQGGTVQTTSNRTALGGASNQGGTGPGSATGGAFVAGSGLGGTGPTLGGTSSASHASIGGGSSTIALLSGGNPAIGGTSNALILTGGTPASGGMPSTGTSNVATVTGSASSVGGNAAIGGANTGGSSGGAAAAGVTIQLNQPHQVIEGFGINDTWATDALPSKLFATTGSDWLGLSILRIGMGEDGKDLSSNIAGDIAMATDAGAKIIGTCWSAPGNCKGVTPATSLGHLLESCYDSWSDTIVQWATGHKLYAMSVGSEPDFKFCADEPCSSGTPYTLFTANEMVAFVKVAGPKLQQAGIRVIAPETAQWNHLWSNVSAGPDLAGVDRSDPLKCGSPPDNPACAQGEGYDYGHWLAADATAWAAFEILGTHQYETQVATPWPTDVTLPRKQIWQTEMAGLPHRPEGGPSSDIANGVAVAGWIHSALVTGEASAWLWWWYKPYASDDNEGLILKNGTPTKRYYTIGNYSRFVRPGYTMVDVANSGNAALLLSAFKGDQGSVAIVVINTSSAPVTVPLTIAGAAAVPTSLTPHVTSSSENLAPGTAVSSSNGTFMVTFGGTTVTTLVSE